MEKKELTTEQKKKLHSLALSHVKNSALSGLKVATLLLLANAAVVVLRIFYVQSDTFLMIGAFLNSIFILPILSRDAKKERDRVREEVTKILQQ